MTNWWKCSRLKEKSVLKLLVTENSIPFETYTRIVLCTEKQVLFLKNVYKWAKREFATTSQRQKDSLFSPEKKSSG